MNGSYDGNQGNQAGSSPMTSACESERDYENAKVPRYGYPGNETGPEIPAVERAEINLGPMDRVHGRQTLRERVNAFIEAFETLQPFALAAYEVRDILDRNYDLERMKNILDEFKL